MANFFAYYPGIAGSGGGGGGGITSINGDTTAAQVISAGTGISVSSSSGTTTITNTSPSSGGTVTSVSVTTANGVSGSVATPTTTPAISLTLGAITPSSVAASGAVSGSNLSGTNTGDQTITLTSDVTGSGTGSFATTIANNVVTNAKAAQMPAHTIKGNNTGSTANAIDLTDTQVTAELDQFTTTLQGVVPGSGGGTTNFLRADGSWASPPGSGGTVSSVDVSGGTTGLTTSGGPVTGSGTITLAGTLAIANGGTGQTTAGAAFGALSPLTTKGDLLSFSTLNARLPVGTDGQALYADSAQTLGVKWATTPNVTQSTAGFVSSAGQLLGTNTNDDATAGNVGETRIRNCIQTSLGGGLTGYQDLVTLTLIAGDWMVSGGFYVVSTSGTVTTSLWNLNIAIQTISGNDISQTCQGINYFMRQNINGGAMLVADSMYIPPFRVSSDGTNLYYADPSTAGAIQTVVGQELRLKIFFDGYVSGGTGVLASGNCTAVRIR